MTDKFSNNKHLKVTIVTISFNQEEFLERAILSVVQQNYDNIEYIVVDPGSSDGSRDIIERYRSKISKVIFEPDQGPADGLNRGFSFATGDIYGFLNSDDIILPDTISRVVKFFRENSDIDVVSGHSIIIDRYDNKIRNGYSEKFSLLKYAYGSVIHMQASTFFRARLFKSTGGFNSLNRVAWDGELLIDMGINGAKFATVNEFWSKFRLHSNSITSSKKLEDLSKQLKANNVNKKGACFWCTYCFDNDSIMIPKYEMKNTYYCYGNFCSPECACSYLMNENIESSQKFERYYLLNIIYSKIYNYEKNIKLAPSPYYTLDKFYGNLNIQEYRKLLKHERLLLIVEKPLSKLLPELYDENEDYILNNKSVNNKCSNNKLYKINVK